VSREAGDITPGSLVLAGMHAGENTEKTVVHDSVTARCKVMNLDWFDLAVQ